MSFPKYPAYKGSRVPWIGEVPLTWEVKAFKWLLDSNDGGVWGDDPSGEGDTLVLRSTDQTVDGNWRITDPAPRKLSAKEKASALLVEGDLVVTKSSGSSLHIGKTTLVTAEIAQQGYCYGNFMQRLRVNSSFTPKLAWYVMNNELARAQLDLLSNSTTGLANLNGTLIGEIFIPVPTVAEQTQIARFLDHETARIDALIEEQQRLIELLKEKRQAVISHAITKGLDPTVPMKDSGVEWLGEVPITWVVKPFKWLLDSNDGGVWGDDPTGEGDTLVLRSTDQAVDGNWRITDPAPRKLSAKEKASALLVEGDLVVTKSSGSSLHIGKTTLVTAEIAQQGYCYGNFMQRLRVNSSFTPKLAWYVMNNELARAQLDLLSNSTTGLANLNGTLIGEIFIPVPTVAEQTQIARFLDHETARIDALIEEANTGVGLLQERRSALISAAVTGKIDVRGWQPPASTQAPELAQEAV